MAISTSTDLSPARSPTGALARVLAHRSACKPTLSLAIGCIVFLLQACSEADLPSRSLRADDCLRDVRLEQLPVALRRCDRVVARFPSDPAPRNERALLLSLNGQDQAACEEIAAAVALARQARPGRVDALLASELRMRHQSCRSDR